jgi:thiol-disulfide isomerase/thioredoxin
MRAVAVTLAVALVAVLGCEDEPSPPAPTSLDPWRDVSDEELDREISTAHERARAANKRVLIDFVATWCVDCREVVRVSALEPARSVIAERYEHVPINVGGWDRARSWRERFAVTRIATLVVLEPDGTKVAQTTLEPISNRDPLTPEALATWLRNPH